MLEAMEYRRLFVKYERPAGSSVVNVTNDGWHVSSFHSEATTEAEFIAECERVSETVEFKEALRVVHS